MDENLPPTIERKASRYLSRFLVVSTIAFLIFFCSLAFVLMTADRGGGLGYIILGISIALLSLLFGILGMIGAWRLRGGDDGTEDELLQGRNLLANWTYSVDEQGIPKEGYVYIGRTGVYKDGDYFHFHGAKRQLLRIDFQSGIPNILTITCEERDRNNSTYPQLVIPVPDSQVRKARQVVERLSSDIPR